MIRGKRYVNREEKNFCGVLVLFAAVCFLLQCSTCWSQIGTDIRDLEVSGYLKNHTDIRVYEPNDIMRCTFTFDLIANYQPKPDIQFYLEMRPFYDAAYDLDTGGLSRKNRGIMRIKHDDYSWGAHSPHTVGTGGYSADAGGTVRNHNVLSTNLTTAYWRQKSLLREFWFRTKTNHWELKIGKQIVTWGMIDKIRNLYSINPSDYRHFILDSPDDSRIPIWMIDVRYYFDSDTSLQFIYIPWYVESFMAPAGSAWAFNGVNLVYYYDHFDCVGIVRDGGPIEIARAACTTDYTEPDNENEFGFRFQGAISDSTDYAINFFYTHQDNNVYVNPIGWNPIQPYSPCPDGTLTKNNVFQYIMKPAVLRIYGLSVNHTFDKFLNLWRDVVMRLELAYYHQHQFFGTNKYRPYGFGYVIGDIGPSGCGKSPGGDVFHTKRNILRTVVEWDKNVFWKGLNWFVSMQLFWEHIFDYPHREDNYISNVGLTKTYQDELSWSLYVNTDFFNERLLIDNFIVWNQMQHDGLNRIRFGYQFSDHLMGWIGDNFFWGSAHSPEPNPFVATADTQVAPGIIAPYVFNSDAETIGHIKRGDPFGEFQRNHHIFLEIQYSF